MGIRDLNQIDFNEHLNPEQFEAVNTLYGPVLVIAGAGSGKTRTLVYRVARLIEEGIDPESILLLTFTRKAAHEMLKRASELVGSKSHLVSGGTFHSFCYSQLRTYCRVLDYPSNFTVLDRHDIEDILGLLAEELGLKKETARFPKKSALASIYSKKRNCMKDCLWVLKRGYAHLTHLAPILEALFDAYQQYKRRHALMDYDDLLINWKTILKNYPEIQEAVSRRFNFIMVDEYQDTNRVQAELVRLMAYTHDNVMAVGDDAQSIYSFRGANFKNILEFPELFPGTRIIKLEKNYRTHQPNLDCTNAIIANAQEKFAKRLVAVRSGGRKPLFYEALDENDQAEFVVSRIKDFILKGVEPSEIAVLFRASFHSFQLEGLLNRYGIKYVKRGGLKLLEGAHIKDLLAFLRIILNPVDRLSVLRVFTLIPGLGEKGVQRIYEAMIKADDPLKAVAEFKTKAKWHQPLKELVHGLLLIKEKDLGLSDLLKGLTSIYEPYLTDRFPDDYPRRLQELNELSVIAGAFEDPGEFLTEVALDPPDEEEAYGKGDAVCLSTIHSAKGLEWKVVFIISLVEGRFPSPMALERDEDLEEERRLFYVAATRAKDALYFVAPRLVNVSGGGVVPGKRSRFLDEIPPGLFEMWGNKSRFLNTPIKQEVTTPKPVKVGGNGFRVGLRVRHQVFGPGTITEVIDNEKVAINFDGIGPKVINTQVAKLSKI